MMMHLCRGGFEIYFGGVLQRYGSEVCFEGCNTCNLLDRLNKLDSGT